jgi:segregation and condensation protein B
MARQTEESYDVRRIERQIEALLFASESPLSIGRLVSLIGVSSSKPVRAAIESLGRFYREHARSFEIIEVAGGYQINTLPEFSSIIASLFKKKRKPRLSQPALETLAIIAYKQPISRAGVETIRGVNCDGVLSTLQDRELITITGRSSGLGRPYLYGTTKKFLEYLGLRDHRELPSMEEFEQSLERMDLFPQPAGGTDEEQSSADADRDDPTVGVDMPADSNRDE